MRLSREQVEAAIGDDGSAPVYSAISQCWQTRANDEWSQLGVIGRLADLGCRMDRDYICCGLSMAIDAQRGAL